MKKNFRVCHMPVIGKPGRVYQREDLTLDEAVLLMETLAEQHLFLEKNNVVADYSNAIWIDQFTTQGDWESLSDDDVEDLVFESLNDVDASEFTEIDEYELKYSVLKKKLIRFEETANESLHAGLVMISEVVEEFKKEK